jgi:hypothetical protein
MDPGDSIPGDYGASVLTMPWEREAHGQPLPEPQPELLFFSRVHLGACTGSQ